MWELKLGRVGFADEDEEDDDGGEGRESVLDVEFVDEDVVEVVIVVGGWVCVVVCVRELEMRVMGLDEM